MRFSSVLLILLLSLIFSCPSYAGGWWLFGRKSVEIGSGTGAGAASVRRSGDAIASTTSQIPGPTSGSLLVMVPPPPPPRETESQRQARFKIFNDLLQPLRDDVTEDPMTSVADGKVYENEISTLYEASLKLVPIPDFGDTSIGSGAGPETHVQMTSSLFAHFRQFDSLLVQYLEKQLAFNHRTVLENANRLKPAVPSESQELDPKILVPLLFANIREAFFRTDSFDSVAMVDLLGLLIQNSLKVSVKKTGFYFVYGTVMKKGLIRLAEQIREETEYCRAQTQACNDPFMLFKVRGWESREALLKVNLRHREIIRIERELEVLAMRAKFAHGPLFQNEINKRKIVILKKVYRLQREYPSAAEMNPLHITDCFSELFKGWKAYDRWMRTQTIRSFTFGSDESIEMFLSLPSED